MKIPSWTKLLLWVVVIGFFTWLLSQRYTSIINGNAAVTDIIILLIWVALIAALMFQEVDFFGVRLRREIDTLKTELKGQITDLRSDIQSIEMRAEVSPHITIGAPSPPSELKGLEESLKPIFEKTLKEHGIEKPASVPAELEVPDDTVYLFKIRYAIEKELARINNRMLWTPPEKRYQSSLRTAMSLYNQGVIVEGAFESIREIYAICSQAIHGQSVPEDSIQFVRDIAPTLLAYLTSIKKQEIPEWMLWTQPPRNWKTRPDKKS